MSRGPGRWQRLLLHAAYHDPKIAPSGRRYINVTDYGTTDAEISALYRAARKIAGKGWAKQCGGQLDPIPVPPAVVANCQLCVSVQITADSIFSGHLVAAGVQVEQFRTPEQQPAVSVPRDYSRWVFGLDGKHYPATTGGPRRDRRIVLARSAGKSMRAIAAEIGCSVGTVHHVLSQWQAIE